MLMLNLTNLPSTHHTFVNLANQPCTDRTSLQSLVRLPQHTEDACQICSKENTREKQKRMGKRFKLMVDGDAAPSHESSPEKEQVHPTATQTDIILIRLYLTCIEPLNQTSEQQF